MSNIRSVTDFEAVTGMVVRVLTGVEAAQDRATAPLEPLPAPKPPYDFTRPEKALWQRYFDAGLSDHEARKAVYRLRKQAHP